MNAFRPILEIGAEEWLQAMNLPPTHRATHITWSSLFAETAELIEAWQRAGYLSVDMETATTFAVARQFGMAAISLLVVWDDLTRAKRFLDLLSTDEQRALRLGNTAVYEVALALVEAA